MGWDVGGGWLGVQPAFMRNILGMVAGYGLLTVTGNEHRMMRKTMNPAFSLSNLIARELFCSSSLLEILIQKEYVRLAGRDGYVL